MAKPPPRRPSGGRGDQARDAVVALFVTLLTAGLLNSAALTRAGEGTPPGATRFALLTVGHALTAVARPLHLDAPRRLANRARGNGTTTDRSPLAEGGGPAPLLGPAAEPDGGPPPARSQADRAAGPPEAGRKAAGGNGHRSRGAPAGPGTWAGPAAPPVRRATPARPAQLLVTGDSLSDYLGPQLAAAFARGRPVHAAYDSHDGTGLTRPRFLDWSLLAGQQADRWRPDVVVMFLGGNENVPMTAPGGAYLAEGTDPWAREYQRRVEVVASVYLRAGAQRVYWLSVPPARDARVDGFYRAVNRALRAAAARISGLVHVDLAPAVAPGGRYSDAIPVAGRGQVVVREPDGVHLNLAGSQLVADLLAARLRRDWRLT